MNRRRFIQSVVAAFSLPAMPSLSLKSATAALPTATAVPTQARFWGIYMSALHGECPPHALESILNIPSSDAKKYVTQLVAEGVIKPNPLLQQTVSKLVKPNKDSVLDKVKKRLEMKAHAETEDLGIAEAVEEIEWFDGESETLEDATEDELAVHDPEEPEEAEEPEEPEELDTHLSQETSVPS